MQISTSPRELEQVFHLGFFCLAGTHCKIVQLVCMAAPL
jgi:hypothetical protein